MTTPAQPWDQLEDETSKAYAAFLTYRNQPPADRTLTTAARATYGPRGVLSNGEAVGRIRDWARENEWADRARAWDAHNEAVRQAAWDKETADAARRHAEEAMLMERVLLEPARLLAESLSDPTKIAQLAKDWEAIPLDQRLRLVDRSSRGHAMVSRFERLSRGLGEERVEVTGADGAPLGGMTIEQARQVMAEVLECEPDEVVDELAAIRRRRREARKKAAREGGGQEDVV